MTTLNNSVVICDVISRSTKKKTPLGMKKTKKTVKRTFYESPLRHIQLSSKRWQEQQAQNKLLRNSKKVVKNKKNVLPLLKDDSLQDSVIVLSDNESELNSKEDENNQRQVTKTGKRPLEVSVDSKQSSRWLRSSSKNLSEIEAEISTPPKKRRKRNIATVPENDSSCLVISDIENTEVGTIDLDAENIVPLSDSVNQGSDDIVVVWSSTKTPSPCKDQSREKTVNKEKDNRIFMIDYSPDPNNVNCLACNDEVICEQCERNTKQNNSKKEEQTYDDNRLPFSRHGLKLPKPHNISNQIAMKKPIIRRKLRYPRRRKTRFSPLVTSTVTSTFTTSNVSTTFIKSTMSTAFIKSTTMPGTFITRPVVCSTQTASESSKVHEPSNSKLSRFEPSRSEVSTSTSSTSDLSTSSSSTSQPAKKLREIVIDGNNVAMLYTNGKSFSQEGLMLIVEYFIHRGHSVKVFVPQYRRSHNHKVLERLYKEGIVIFTPSRNIGGRSIVPYDDRYILEYATMCGGIVVSSDQYRDLYMEKPNWRDTIENRLLAPTFVGKYVMFPEDPLGRNGPKLEEFLKY